jgi:hypothetical protein
MRSEMRWGITTNGTTLFAAIRRLRQGFAIGFCVVADRGMISKCHHPRAPIYHQRLTRPFAATCSELCDPSCCEGS